MFNMITNKREVIKIQVTAQTVTSKALKGLHKSSTAEELEWPELTYTAGGDEN